MRRPSAALATTRAAAADPGERSLHVESFDVASVGLVDAGLDFLATFIENLVAGPPSLPLEDTSNSELYQSPLFVIAGALTPGTAIGDRRGPASGAARIPTCRLSRPG